MQSDAGQNIRPGGFRWCGDKWQGYEGERNMAQNNGEHGEVFIYSAFYNCVPAGMQNGGSDNGQKDSGAHSMFP